MGILQLCRFDRNRTLSYHDFDVHKVSYIAISHLWTENTTWVSIPGVPGRVKASVQKASFIAKRLPELVGNKLFWMDILAVDQADKAAVFAIVCHIPAIYRNAEKTTVVREDGGFRSCCWDITPPEGPPDIQAGIYREHLNKFHNGVFDEKWLTRVWPYQEMKLSRTLQFVVCESTSSLTIGPGKSDSDAYDSKWIAYEHVGRFMDQLKELRYLEEEWFIADETEQEFFRGLQERSVELLTTYQKNKCDDFRKAIFRCGTVSRGLKNQRTATEYENGNEAFMLGSPNMAFSERVASRPHDLVLALFPSCGWYKTPDDARYMTVGELWSDAFLQLRRNAGYSMDTLAPKFTMGMFDADVDLLAAADPSTNIPVPSTLGDLTRLFMDSDPRQTRHHPVLDLKALKTPWTVQKIDADLTMTGTLEIVTESMHFSQSRVLATELVYIMNAFRDIDKTVPTFANAPAGYGSTEKRDAQTLNKALIRKKELYIALETLLTISDLCHNVIGRIDALESRRRKQVFIYEEWWKSLVASVTAYDTPSLRSLLLYVTAISTNQLRITALDWTMANMQPCTLHPSPRGVVGGVPRILVLTAKNFIPTPADEVSLWDGPADKYLCIKSPRDGMLPRIVGMLPLPLSFSLNVGSMIFINHGCPVVIPIENTGVTPEEYIIWCRINAELQRRTKRNYPFVNTDDPVINPRPDTRAIAKDVLRLAALRNGLRDRFGERYHLRVNCHNEYYPELARSSSQDSLRVLGVVRNCSAVWLAEQKSIISKRNDTETEKRTLSEIFGIDVHININPVLC